MLLLTALPTAHARSSGLFLSSDTVACNLLMARLGCISNWTLDVNDGHRSMCNDVGGNTKTNMWWVGAPQVSPNHTFRSGDGDVGADPANYVPGQTFPLYLRTIQARANFKGFMLYAVDSNEVKVGSWQATPEQEEWAGIYPSHVCPFTLMHLDANNKRLLNIFYFTAPPAGTGTITFRLLLKTGAPNPAYSGDFLWPTSNLTLREGASVASNPWILLPNGTSCDSYCRSKGSLCNPSSLASLRGWADTWKYLSNQYPCDEAIQAECSSSAPGVVGGYCSYFNDSCNGLPATSQPSCTESSTTDNLRFCSCGIPTTAAASTTPTSGTGTIPTSGTGTIPTSGTGATRTSGTGTGPSGTGTAPPKSPATRSSLFSPVALISCLLALFSVNKPRFFPGWVLGTVLITLPYVSAHNFPEGVRGRAPNANTIYPTFPQLDTSMIHMQVNPGQEVLVEWAPAHFDYTYLVVFHAANESKMIYHNRTSLNDYLLNCPYNATEEARKPRKQKYHWAPPNINLDDSLPIGMGLANNSIYASIVDPLDPEYIGPRPLAPPFRNRICPHNSNPGYGGFFPAPPTGFPASIKSCNDTYQVKFKPFAINGDARCEYYSEKYPWIEAVHRYQHNNYNGEIDVALLSIPARNGPGRYEIHYIWSAYRDTFDVDVQPPSNPVTQPYGTPGTVAPFGSAEHCIFEDAKGFKSSCIEVVTNAQQCISSCTVDGSCLGVAVVPLNGPPPFTGVTHIPWNWTYCNFTRFSNVPKDAKICYTVTAYRDSAAGALTPWTFVNDPDDIGFYSTCYVKQQPRNWMYKAAIPAPVAYTDYTFRYGTRCIPCEDRALKTLVNQTIDWKVGDCVDCNLHPVLTPRSLAKPKPPSWSCSWQAPYLGCLNFTGGNCVSSCVKWISPAGSSYAWEDECAILAARDPECSKQVMFSQNIATKWKNSVHQFTNAAFLTTSGMRSCACWRKEACCGTAIVDPKCTVFGMYANSANYTVCQL